MSDFENENENENINEGLHTVPPLSDEYLVKLKRHRRKIAIVTASLILMVIASAIVILIYFSRKTYDQVEVVSTIEREDTVYSDFECFNGQLLKITTDGTSYSNRDGSLIWNQTYEMNNPTYEIKGKYVALFERGGNVVYVLDNINMCGSINTTMPIMRVSIANNGTVAVLMETDGVSYLQLFDKAGNQLATGEIYAKNSGYPMDIALSDNGEKMAVSMLDINSGAVKTTLTFYNFGAVGQNEIDKIVGSYSFSNLVIPEISYLKGDAMAAFADDRVIIFGGSQKPTEEARVSFKENIKSIFTSDSYFGMVFDNASDEGVYRYEIYDLSGKQVANQIFDIDYSEIYFLNNNDVCVTDGSKVEIYTISGIKRLVYDFDIPLYKVMSENNRFSYTFVLDSETRKCRLR